MHPSTAPFVPGPQIRIEGRSHGPLAGLTFAAGGDLATVNLEFKVRGHDLIGRQSQTWVRLPDLGWKVIAAHVSTVSAKPFW